MRNAVALVTVLLAATPALALECPAEPPDTVRLRPAVAELEGAKVRLELELEDPLASVETVKVVFLGDDDLTAKVAYPTSAGRFRVTLPASRLGADREIRFFAAAIGKDGDARVCFGTESEPRRLSIEVRRDAEEALASAEEPARLGDERFRRSR